jgi:ABC-2 type transport system ATP-binding protein
MSDATIEMEEVVKIYPGGARALDSVTLTVRAGSVCAFLGRNGAGKTTAVRVLSTLTRKTSGRAAICGLDIDTRPAEVRRLIGVALQNSALDGQMTGREHLELVAGLAGYRGRSRRQRADDLLGLLDLSAVGGQLVGTYSGGMRRRLDLGLALIQRPRVLFLDELSSGLDLQSRQTVWTVIGDLRAQGATILLATHDLSEAGQLSDTIAVIDAGRIRAVGSAAQLKAELGERSLEGVFVRLTGDPHPVPRAGLPTVEVSLP